MTAIWGLHRTLSKKLTDVSVVRTAFIIKAIQRHIFRKERYSFQERMFAVCREEWLVFRICVYVTGNNIYGSILPGAWIHTSLRLIRKDQNQFFRNEWLHFSVGVVREDLFQLGSSLPSSLIMYRVVTSETVPLAYWYCLSYSSFIFSDRLVPFIPTLWVLSPLSGHRALFPGRTAQIFRGRWPKNCGWIGFRTLLGVLSRNVPNSIHTETEPDIFSAIRNFKHLHSSFSVCNREINQRATRTCRPKCKHTIFPQFFLQAGAPFQNEVTTWKILACSNHL